MHKPIMINHIRTFLREVRAELGRVKWPSREDTLRMTAVVIIISVVLGIYIGAIDFGLTKVVETFIR